MNSRYVLSSLSDERLVSELARVVGLEREVLADVLAHLAEMDRRRLYRIHGCRSLFAYCTEVLGMTGDEAYNRIRAARVAQQWSYVFDDVAAGALSLSAIKLVAPYVKSDDALLQAARGKTIREIEQMVASVAPKPEVADSIRPIGPDRVEVRFSASMRFRDKLEHARALLSHSLPEGRFEEVLERALDAVIEKAEKTRFAATDRPRPAPRSGKKRGSAARKAAPVVGHSERPAAGPTPAPARLPAGTTDGASAPVEADRPRTRYISASVRRRVATRDEYRCTYVGIDGRRCSARAFLQYHHPMAKAAAMGRRISA